MPSTADRERLSWLDRLGGELPGGLATLATAASGERVEVLTFLSAVARRRCAPRGGIEGLAGVPLLLASARAHGSRMASADE